MTARPHLLRWWLFGAALWLSERTGRRGVLRLAVWLAGPTQGERRW